MVGEMKEQEGSEHHPTLKETDDFDLPTADCSG
jgi:hypothetical protein